MDRRVAGDADEGDVHARDRPLERRIAGRVVDHDDGLGTETVADLGAIHASAEAAVGDRDLTRHEPIRGEVGLEAAEAFVIGCPGDVLEVVELPGDRQVVRLAVGVDAPDVGSGRHIDPHRGERGIGIHGRHRDAARGDTWRARDVRAGTAVAGRHDDRHASDRRVVDGERVSGAGVAEGGAERHVDDVGAVAHRPLDGVDHDGRAAVAAEDAVGHQRGSGSRAGADPEVGVLQGRGVVGAKVGGAVLANAVARRGARDVRAVLDVGGLGVLAVERVGIRIRIVVAVIGIAHEVIARDDLLGGEVAVRAVQPVVGRVLRLSLAAEVGVVVVDAGVDDGEPDALAGEAGRAPGLVGADEAHRVRVVAVVLGHCRDLRHAREPGDLRELAGGDADAHGVEHVRVRRLDRGAHRPQLRLEALLLAREWRAQRGLLGFAELSARVKRGAHMCRHRLAGQLDEDVHDAVRVAVDRQLLDLRGAAARVGASEDPVR